MVTINHAKWAGLRLQLSVGGAQTGASVDLRTKAADPASSVLPETQRLKALAADGGISITVEDDGMIGQAAILVVIHDGQVVAKQTVTIGEQLRTWPLDALDQIAATAFDGYIVRKDLVRRFKGQYPVPTYVAEFLLGRYCASTDEARSRKGWRSSSGSFGADRPGGEEELFKARAGARVGQADRHHHAPAWTPRPTRYVAELPSLQLKDVRISRTSWSADNERMLTGGFYAEIDLAYDATHRPGEERPAVRHRVAAPDPAVEARRAGRTIQRPGARSRPTSGSDFLLRSIGLEPAALTPRTRDVMLLRMVPFVERNYNLVELGPRGTGKSHLFQQISPYAHLVSGGKATVARMFVNNANGQRGLVCQYDVVCFDEVSGVSFDQKDGVNIMKGYMESGEFSRGKESIRPTAASSWSATSTWTCSTSSGSATCSARCRRRCATTPPSWTASTPTCPAGTCRR